MFPVQFKLHYLNYSKKYCFEVEKIYHDIRGWFFLGGGLSKKWSDKVIISNLCCIWTNHLRSCSKIRVAKLEIVFLIVRNIIRVTNINSEWTHLVVYMYMYIESCQEFGCFRIRCELYLHGVYTRCAILQILRKQLGERLLHTTNFTHEQIIYIYANIFRNVNSLAKKTPLLWAYLHLVRGRCKSFTHVSKRKWPLFWTPRGPGCFSLLYL